MSRSPPLFGQEPMFSPPTLRLTISSATVHSKSQFEGRAPMPRASCAGARPPRSLTPSLRPRPCTLFRTPRAHVASQRAARHQVQASLRHAHIFLAIHPRSYIQPPAIRFAAYGSISPPAQTSQNWCIQLWALWWRALDLRRAPSPLGSHRRPKAFNLASVLGGRPQYTMFTHESVSTCTPCAQEEVERERQLSYANK